MNDTTKKELKLEIFQIRYRSGETVLASYWTFDEKEFDVLYEKLRNNPLNSRVTYQGTFDDVKRFNRAETKEIMRERTVTPINVCPR